MKELVEYDVLKMVMHGERCYLSTDCIHGMTLAMRLKDGIPIPKERFYQWMMDWLKDLERFYMNRGNTVYQYVNPYSMIIGEDDKVYLLDLGGESGEDALRFMQRRQIREEFLSKNNQYYQKADVREEIYSIGKTIQYMLTHGLVEPGISFSEKRRFRKIISKCLHQNQSKSYHSIQELSNQLPNLKRDNIKNTRKRKAILFICAVLIAGVAMLKISVGTSEESKEQSESAEIAQMKEEQERITNEYEEQLEALSRELKEQEENERKEALNRERDLIYDLVICNFVYRRDYKKSEEYLQSLTEKDQLDRELKLMCGFFSTEVDRTTDDGYRSFVERLVEAYEGDTDSRRIYLVLKAIEEQEDQTELIRELAQSCLEDEKIERWADETVINELQEMKGEEE